MPATATPGPDLVGLSDEDLNALVNQLSGPVGVDKTGRVTAPGVAGRKFGTLPSASTGGGLPSLGQLFTNFKIQSLSNSWRLNNRRNESLAKIAAYNRALTAAFGRAQKEKTFQLSQAQNEIQRRQLMKHINSSFAAPGLDDLYSTIENDSLQSKLGDVVDQYSAQLRGAGFQTAGQGLVGSSVDAERRGAVKQGADAAAVQAEGEAHDYAQSIKDQNEQQRQALISTVSAGGPADAAQADSRIQGIVNQTRMLGQQTQSTINHAGIDAYGNQLQSQALGGLLGGYGNSRYYSALGNGATQGLGY